MKVGVTGHQERESIDWTWVRSAIRAELHRYAPIECVYSSLAVGTDQIFAEVAIELGIACIAVIPMEGYERYFSGNAVLQYRRLLERSQVEQLRWKGDAERSFYEAGKHVADQCDILFAVWDGEEAEGFGGTADIVAYARAKKLVKQFDPIAKAITSL